MELDTHITSFHHYLRFEKRYSAHTIAAYAADLHHFRDYLSRESTISEAAAVRDIHIRGWLVSLKEQKLKERSLLRKMSSVKSFFRYLCEQQHISANPAVRIRLPKAPKRLPVFLEAQDTEQLLEDVRFANGFEGFTEWLIIELLYQTGMRRMELVQLKETDVEFSRKQLRILGKGNKERLVPLSQALLVDVKEYINEKRKIFSEPDKFLLSLKSGKRIYPQYVYRVVQKYLKGLTTLSKKSPHVMRHTFATQLLNNGAELNAIKELLGHSSLAATQVYTHNNIEKLKEAYRKAHPRS